MAGGRGDIVFEIGGNTSSLASAGAKGASALAVMEKAAKQADVQIKALERSSTAFQKSVASATGLDKVTKSARESALAFEKLAKAQDNMSGLRAQIDPLYAASMRYAEALRLVDDALEAGAISSAEHAAMTERVGKAYLTAGSEVQATGAKLGGIAGIVGNNRAAVQMFGYQIQDVAVQLAAGTRATTVFAQQGSQMLGMFGAYGALAGAALAVTLPLAGAFFSAGEGAKDAEKAISELGSSFDAYTAYIRTATSSTADLSDEFGQWAGQVRGFAEFMAANQLATTMDDLRAALDPIKGSLADIQGQWQHIAEYQAYINELVAQDATPEMIQNARDNLAMFQDNLLETADTLGITAEQAMALGAAIDDIGKAQTMAEVAAAAGRALTLLESMADASGTLPAPLRKAADTLGQIHDKAAKAATETAKLPGILNAAASAARSAAAGVSGIATAAQNAYGPVAALAEKLWEAGRAKAGLNDLTGQNTGNADWAKNDLGFVKPGSELVYTPPKKSKGGGGSGGGGKKDQTAEQLKRLQDGLMGDAEAEQARFAEQQQLLEDALAKKLVTLDKYNSLMEAAQTAHNQKMTDIDVWRYGDGLDKTEAFMGAMAKAFQGGNEKMQKIGQVFAAAETLINAWRAYSQVLADPSLPFFAKVPAALSVLAAGMKAVQAVKGMGGGSSSSAKTSGASTAAAAAPSPANVNIQWNGAMTAGSMGSLTKKLNEEYKQGYRINFVTG